MTKAAAKDLSFMRHLPLSGGSRQVSMYLPIALLTTSALTSRKDRVAQVAFRACKKRWRNEPLISRRIGRAAPPSTAYPHLGSTRQRQARAPASVSCSGPPVRPVYQGHLSRPSTNDLMHAWSSTLSIWTPEQRHLRQAMPVLAVDTFLNSGTEHETPSVSAALALTGKRDSPGRRMLHRSHSCPLASHIRK
jgi:hypothetical protein